MERQLDTSAIIGEQQQHNLDLLLLLCPGDPHRSGKDSVIYMPSENLGAIFSVTGKVRVTDV